MERYQLKAHSAFSPEEAAAAFDATFLDMGACRAWVLHRIHPDGAACPHCGVALTGHRITRFYSGGRLRCPECARFFTALTGTPFMCSHFGYRRLFLLAALAGLGLPDRTIAGFVDAHPATVRNWRERFRLMQVAAGER